MVEKIGLRPCISSPFENLGFVVKVLDDYMLTFDDDGNLSKEDMTKLVGLIMREAKGCLNPVLITDYSLCEEHDRMLENGELDDYYHIKSVPHVLDDLKFG